MLGAMEDPSLPLTQQEYLEWGDPGDSLPRALIESYSPFENIPRGCVPPSLLLTCMSRGTRPSPSL